MTRAALIDDEALGMLEDSLARYAAEQYTFESRRRALAGAQRYSMPAWQDYARNGWLSLSLPERLGGLDGHPQALASLMRYAGRSLAMEPLFASAIVSARLLARASATERMDDLSSGIASGAQVVVFAHAEDAQSPAEAPRLVTLREGRLSGHKTLTLHASAADWLLVSARRAEDDAVVVAAVEAGAAGLSIRPTPLLDGREAAYVAFDNTPAVPLAFGNGAEQAIAEVLEEACASLCAEAQGMAEALVEQTLAYVKTRVQFGRTIGSNQVIQHRLVDLFVLRKEIDAVTGAAQRALLSDGSGRAAATSGGLAYAIGAIRRIAQDSVQLHGGVGMTDELPISHYFRRAMVIERLLGGRETHLDAFARAQARRDP